MVYSHILRIIGSSSQFSRSTKYALQVCKFFHGVFPHQRLRMMPLAAEIPRVSGTECVLSKVAHIRCRSIHISAKLDSKDDPGHRDPEVSVAKSHASPPGLSATQKVKQAGKDFTYLIVVLIGLGITGGLLYVVFQELFSSSSPSKVYGKAFKMCKSHPEVIGAFGEPIKGFGETSRRGRRQQVSHVEYMKDGLKHMRLKFYIEGSEPGLQGTVHSESKENPETGKYEFRYIFVEIDTYPRRTIVVEDNRF